LNENLTIRHHGIVLLLSIEPIDKVFPHEEILPDVLGAIGESLKNSASQLDPVIIDNATGVALDGMHRVEALRSMGASKILACRVDYGIDSIKVGRWLRAYEGTSNPLLEDLKVRLNLTRVSRAEALSEVEGHRVPAALFAGGISFKSLMPFVSVRESIELVRVFDETALRSEVRPRIVDEEEAGRLIEKGAFVFVPPSPTKADVIESGLRRHLFPPKSTRHLIPARPVGVSFPLRWLLDAQLSAEEANGRLSDLVAWSRIVALPPGSVYMGRTYDEPLYRYVREGKRSRSP
jgi:hypothetical protein